MSFLEREQYSFSQTPKPASFQRKRSLAPQESLVRNEVGSILKKSATRFGNRKLTSLASPAVNRGLTGRHHSVMRSSSRTSLNLFTNEAGSLPTKASSKFGLPNPKKSPAEKELDLAELMDSMPRKNNRSGYQISDDLRKKW